MHKIINIYNGLALKLIPQRLAIYTFFYENMGTAPSAEDIFYDLEMEYPSLSPATVYNRLDALVKKGEIVEIRVNP